MICEFALDRQGPGPRRNDCGIASNVPCKEDRNFVAESMNRIHSKWRGRRAQNSEGSIHTSIPLNKAALRCAVEWSRNTTVRTRAGGIGS